LKKYFQDEETKEIPRRSRTQERIDAKERGYRETAGDNPTTSEFTTAML
jgi:hypothetical protein